MSEAATVGTSVRLVNDTATGERGIQIRVTNRTGGASVKGQVITPSGTYDNAVELVNSAAPYVATGVVYEGGVADGSDMWCWTTGSACEVLMQDSDATTRGNWVRCSSTVNGRAFSDTLPTPPTADTHFQEIGHAMESNAGGTDQLVLIWFHTL